MFRKILIIVLVCLFSSAHYALAQYSDNDLLIDKLVEKGYLSNFEADILKDETKDYVATHMNEGRLISLPQWVQGLEFKADLRIRSQYEKQKGADESRLRQRVRARVGLIKKINQTMSAGIGIATSSDGDPRSTNITLDDSFDRADVRLDYAYLEYRPFLFLNAIFGKFPKKDYLWTPSDAFWDSDINPGGTSVHLEKNLGLNHTFFGNAGFWIIDEVISKADDPQVYFAQPGYKFENDSFDATVAGSFYNFEHIKGKRLDNTSCTNSGLTLNISSCVGSVTTDFLVYGTSAEVGYRKMINEKFKRAAIFGEFMTNDRAEKEFRQGWAFGFKIGDMKLKELKDWLIKYQYTHLEKDVVPDILPSSDRYEGRTGIKGHKIGLEFALAENVTGALTYYRDEILDSTDDEHQSLYQVDVKVNF